MIFECFDLVFFGDDDCDWFFFDYCMLDGLIVVFGCFGELCVVVVDFGCFGKGFFDFVDFLGDCLLLFFVGGE